MCLCFIVEIPLTCHSFRHGFGTHLYENGTDLLTNKHLMGHKSLNSTLIYIHLGRFTEGNCKRRSGICQERLRFWGEDVQVAVTTEDNSLLFVSLGELQRFRLEYSFAPLWDYVMRSSRENGNSRHYCNSDG